MNAKDKEKLDVAGTIVGFMKGDTIVIDPDEFRRRADIKNCDIAIHIAHKTAARFEDMADGMEMSTLKQIVRRIEDADPESVVPMLQAMFFARGMVDIAEDLDMLELCSKYDEDTYFVFFDILFDTDIFEWFSIENMFDDFHYEDERRSD